jgi:lysophospholipase L1-like esterase
LEKVLSVMRPGDWLFLQYGHNDMKSVGAAAYQADLKLFVQRTQQQGGRPVLVTPMQRRTFDGDEIINSHRDFPDAVRELAAEMNLPLIDLHAASKQLYEALGTVESARAFATAMDGTHHSNYGAYELAKCIVQGIRVNRLPLARFLREDVTAFDPARPDSWKEFAVPASMQISGQRPEGD